MATRPATSPRTSFAILAAAVAATGMVAVSVITPVGARAQDCGVGGETREGIAFPSCPQALAAPAPSYRVLKVLPPRADGHGGFIRQAIIDITPDYVPGNALIWALGPGLTALDVTSDGTLNSLTGRLPQGALWTLVSRPWGRFTVSLTTADPKAPVQLHLDFNHRNPPPK